MADLEPRVIDAVRTALSELDELNIARRVHDAWRLYTAAGLKPADRLRDCAKVLELTAGKVRRYLCLHLAPEEIRELYRTKKLSGRLVELLQSVPAANQSVLAKQIIDGTHFGASAERFVTYEANRQNGVPKGWNEDAAAFEIAVLRAIELLDPYVDAPRGRLIQIFQGAGGSVGRRSLIALIEEQVELLIALRNTLEGVRGEEGANGARTSLVDSS